MALALDGTVHKNITTGSSTTVTLSTSIAGDVIVAILEINDTTCSSISSPNTTGWTLRKRQDATPPDVIEEWVGVAAAALSSEVITVTLAAGTSYCTIDIFGISGANTTTIWDSNAALPDAGTTSLRSITTSNANDFLIGAYRVGTANPTAGAGWTQISGAHFQLVEYQIVSATQSGLSVTIGTGNGLQNGGIGDAIVMAGGGAAATITTTILRRTLSELGTRSGARQAC